MDVHALEQGSLVILEAICPSDRLGEVHQDVSAILRQLQQQVPSATELKRAKRLLDHGHRFSMEGIGSLAQHLGQATLMKRLEPLEEPLSRWHQWQAEDLQQLSRDLDPDLACTLLVRPK
jgi:predicted Zn-dependent peptidase